MVGGERRVVGCSFPVDKNVCRSSGLRLEESWMQAALAPVGNSTSESRRKRLANSTPKRASKVGGKDSVFSRNSKDAPEGKARDDKVRCSRGRMVLQVSVPQDVCLLWLYLSNSSTFWLHLTSVAVLCCFAVNPLAVPHSSASDTKAAGS